MIDWLEIIKIVIIYIVGVFVGIYITKKEMIK